MNAIINYLKPRVTNYGFWVSIFALIPLILKAFGVTIIPDYENIVHTILGLLVVMGIVSNPTTVNKGFGDDLVEESIPEQK
ncbi:MAG: hypothetical protein ACRCST_17640 [Turicibacter sp.]